MRYTEAEQRGVDLAAQIVKLAREMPRVTDLNSANVAEHFGMSETSLRRALREGGARLSDLIESERWRRIFAAFQADPWSSCARLAQVGEYAEPNSFTRAFIQRQRETFTNYSRRYRALMATKAGEGLCAGIAENKRAEIAAQSPQEGPGFRAVFRVRSAGDPTVGIWPVNDRVEITVQDDPGGAPGEFAAYLGGCLQEWFDASVTQESEQEGTPT